MSESQIDSTTLRPAGDPVVRTALAGEVAENSLWSLRELPFSSKVNVRVDADSSAWRSLLESLSLSVPAPNSFHATDTTGVFWLGPDEFLLRSEENAVLAPDVRRGLADEHAGVVDVSDYYTVFRLAIAAGDQSTDTDIDVIVRGHLDVYSDLVAKLSPLDTRAQKFGVQSCAQTRMGDAAVLLSACQPGDAMSTSTVPSARQACDVQVRWSFAPYLWNLLCRAARLPENG